MIARKQVIYCRYSDEHRQHEDSLEAQERKVRQKLAERGIDVSDAIVLRDAGISGRLESRPQFDLLREMIRKKELSLVAVDELSRLSRGSKTLGFIQGMVFRETRFISTGEDIDTEREGWEDTVEIYAFHHRRSSKETGRRCRRSMELRVLTENGSDGSMPFGYSSTFESPNWAEEVRLGKTPRKIVIIDEAQAQIVREIFTRYAVDGWSINRIARDLTQRCVPKGRKGKKPYWTRQYVNDLLQNTKYVGIWTWGEKETIYDDEGNMRYRNAVKNKPVTKERPQLRIVSQSIWDKAVIRRATSKQQYAHRNAIALHPRHMFPVFNLGGLIDLPMTKIVETDVYCYSEAEVAAVIGHCVAKPELKWLGDVIVGLAYTGLRIGELAQLRWTAIDLDANAIRVIDNSGTTARIDNIAETTTKTHRSRTLPIHPEFRRILEGMARHSDGRVFHGPLGGKLKPDTVRRTLIDDVLTPLKQKFPDQPGARCFSDGRVHSFRHFFCSWCAASGVPEQVVMKWLGHRSSNMVKHYFHLRDEEAQRQMAKLKPVNGVGAGGSSTPAVPAEENGAQ